MLFASFLVFAGLSLATVAVSYLVSGHLTRPTRKPPGPTPADVGLPFEKVAFPSHDGQPLVGWLVGPKLAAPPLLILHGYSDNKSSYLDRARFLFENGYPSFIYDHRGHGESGSARVSLGPLEARDAIEALQMLSEKTKAERFVLWGVSMGAASALLAATGNRKVAGVISESSYGRLDEALADTFWTRYRLPRFPLAPLALRFASSRLGVSLCEVDIAEAVEALGAKPLLVISGGRDPRMPPAVGERLLARARGETDHLVVPEADHAECWLLGQPEYGEKVLQLIRSAGIEPAFSSGRR